jgi:heme exporter protein D
MPALFNLLLPSSSNQTFLSLDDYSLFVWLVLVCSEIKVLLADCWWLVCSERKILLAGG